MERFCRRSGARGIFAILEWGEFQEKVEGKVVRFMLRIMKK